MAQAMRSTHTNASVVRSSAMRSAMPRSVARPRVAVVRAGLLDFFRPKTGTPTDPRAVELVQELIDVTTPTVAGTRANANLRQEIEDLAEELQKFGLKNPARNKLLNGEFQLLYTSQPSAAGSPLAGPNGAITPGAELPIEAIETDGSYYSTVNYKKLGVVSSTFTRSGTYKVLNDNSYLIEINQTESGGFGAPQVKKVDNKYEVQTVYLGERLRIVEVFPAGSKDGVLLISKRVVDEPLSSSDDEQPANRPFGSMIMNKPQQSGAATVAERQVLKQMAKDKSKGTGSVQVSANKQADAQRAKEEAEAEKAAQAARNKEDADKRAQSSIRDMLNSLTDAVKVKGAEAKGAMQDYKGFERNNAAAVKNVTNARSKLEQAQVDSNEAEAALRQARSELLTAETKFKEAQEVAVQAKSRYLQEQAAARPDGK